MRSASIANTKMALRGRCLFRRWMHELENGDLQIKQLIVNNTKPEERLNFECNLYIPNRKRMQRSSPSSATAATRRSTRCPDARVAPRAGAAIAGQQIGSFHEILNLRWKVGENWETAGERTTADRTPPTRRAHRREPRTLPSEPPKS